MSIVMKKVKRKKVNKKVKHSKKVNKKHAKIRKKVNKKVKHINYQMTDMGNARLFADMFSGKVRWDTTTGMWLAWDGKRWNKERGYIKVAKLTRKVAAYWKDKCRERKEAVSTYLADKPSRNDDENEEVMQLVKIQDATYRWWKRTSSANGVQAMIYLVKSESGIAVSHKDLDKDIYLLNVLDGTIDLRTGELRDHNPNDLITQLANVSYRKDKDYIPIPKWKKSLAVWHPKGNSDGTWKYLQQLMGLCLTGDIGSRCMGIWWGHGKNGKNGFLDNFLLMLGDYAATASRTLIEAEKMDSHPTEIAALHKKRLVVASEPKMGSKLKTNLVKAMTGDMELTARYMRQDFFEFQPTHKMIMLTQHLPIVNETDDAIWDRLHKLEWSTRIAKRNQIPNYAKVYLKDEWPGILRWAIKGYLELRKTGQGILFPTKNIEQQTLRYRKEQNAANVFVNRYFETTEDDRDFTPSSTVNDMFSAWLEQLNGSMAQPTKHDLDNYLRSVGCKNKNRRAGSKPQRGWTCLKKLVKGKSSSQSQPKRKTMSPETKKALRKYQKRAG